ncbi:MAG TPA: DUF2199 domain-containing protein [Candidatus Angelobacter sp.]|nr:DUF2199 domain-containing protein [Candidatus Angelobacter sp.]
MAEKIHCDTHGESDRAFVCSHLLEATPGLGFNSNIPDDENPFPDAWCDNCEIILATHGGWNEESKKLVKIVVLCSGCYERARILHTRTTVTLADLADLRWKCGDCEEWHTGPCLDFGYSSPYYWRKEHEEESRKASLLPGWSEEQQRTFLSSDYCAVDDNDFFVRGVIHLPIIGAAETLRWGVWGSLSRENFKRLREMDGKAECVDLPHMFSWLSTKLPGYPDTLSLKMFAHIQEPGLRPHFRLEREDHPLSHEYHQGISAERVKEIMMEILGKNA